MLLGVWFYGMMYVHVRYMWRMVVRIGESFVSVVGDYERFGNSVVEDSVVMIYGAAPCTLNTVYGAASYTVVRIYGAASCSFIMVHEAASYIVVRVYGAASRPAIFQLGDHFYAVSSSLVLVRPLGVLIPESLPTKVVNCVVLCIVCVLYYCHRVSTQLQLTNILTSTSTSLSILT
jgi:hypothetical protein